MTEHTAWQAQGEATEPGGRTRPAEDRGETPAAMRHTAGRAREEATGDERPNTAGGRGETPAAMRHSPLLSGAAPKHLQLREILLDLIEAAQPEEPIPSERELAMRYGVARMTVRQAVESLVAEGRLFKVTGKGTFVAGPKVDLQARLTSFSEEMTRRGMRASSTVLAFTRMRATAHLARELACEVNDDLVHLKQLRFADDVPMAVERAWLPHRLVPGLIDGPPPESLYEVLAKRYGLVPDWGEDTIEAGAADHEVANYLGVRPGSPQLQIERHSYAGQTLVSYSVSFYRADRYKLWVPLARPQPPIHNPRK